LPIVCPRRDERDEVAAFSRTGTRPANHGEQEKLGATEAADFEREVQDTDVDGAEDRDVDEAGGQSWAKAGNGASHPWPRRHVRVTARRFRRRLVHIRQLEAEFRLLDGRPVRARDCGGRSPHARGMRGTAAASRAARRRPASDP